jgi:hypothetical protein
VVGCCDDGNEHSGFIIGGYFSGRWVAVKFIIKSLLHAIAYGRREKKSVNCVKQDWMRHEK